MRQYDDSTGQWEECDGYNVDANITMRQGTELDGRKSYREFCDSIFHVTDRELEAALNRRNHERSVR